MELFHPLYSELVGRDPLCKTVKLDLGKLNKKPKLYRYTTPKTHRAPGPSPKRKGKDRNLPTINFQVLQLMATRNPKHCTTWNGNRNLRKYWDFNYRFPQLVFSGFLVASQQYVRFEGGLDVFQSVMRNQPLPGCQEE